MLSLEVLNGKRLHEILLLEQLLRQENILHDSYVSLLATNNCRTDEATSGFSESDLKFIIFHDKCSK